MLDLLDRKRNIAHPADVENAVGGKRVLITGAGGTIGSEIARMVADGNPSEIALLGHSEHPIYTIRRELAEKHQYYQAHAVIADIRDRRRILDVFEDFAPDAVFHAAAIKHVSLAEQNPDEAILTNVVGTQNIITACKATSVPRMVYISTDKAVNPVGVMGATKRAGELLCAAADLCISTVRLVNVLGSSGSVVPLFADRIQRGLPVVVTHPDVTRYFMTVEEAASAAIRAIMAGKGLFVPEVGEPVRIYDLACRMIEESGKDIEINFCGLQPGEKLAEQIMHEGESLTFI